MNTLNKVSKIAAFVLLLCLCFAVTACDFDESKNNFYGGEILDEEVLESIRDALTDVTDTETVDETTEKGEQTDLNDDTESVGPEVFWIENGSVWHIYEDCRYIDGRDLSTGSVADAIDAGKERLCSACEKKLEQETLETETTDSETTEPVSTEPETTIPETTDPETTEPDTTEPDTKEPDTNEPDTTESERTELDTTEPDTTEPNTTEPETTEIETSELDTTESDTTEPDTTESETTEPETTELETTDPETTEPEMTELETERDENTVYWLETGSVWHNRVDCRYIKGKNYISGTVEEAENQGKSKLCSACDKSDDDPTESDEETECETTEELTEEEQTEAPEIENGDMTVYWIESGSVWHNDPECRHIKGKEYVSGTVEEAMQDGMERICKSCEN